MSDDNPYAAPQAPVALPPAPAEPLKRIPPIVAIPVLLLAVALVAFGLLRLIRLFPAVSVGEVSGLTLLVTAVVLVLRGWVLFKVWRGRNWARIALAVIVALGALGEILRWTTLMSLPGWRARMVWDWWQYLMAAQPAVTVIAAALLFTPAAAPWFRRARSA